jgi:prepilin-type N-terminal cleavage/methylation domain-containing protein
MGTTTTSRIGDPAAGFTLLEILLALAVIGLLSAVLIGGSARLLATKPLTPDDVFWKAVAQARKDALERGGQNKFHRSRMPLPRELLHAA